MNADVRLQFQKVSGFDPQLLFDESSPYFWKTNSVALAQWSKFRTGLTRDWLAEVIDHAAKRPIDVIVTALDNVDVPSIVESTGCDARDAVALMDRF